MAAGRVTELPKVTEGEDPALERQAEGFDNGLAWKRVRYRDVEYKLTELDIGEYLSIEEKVTKTVTAVDGTETEDVDEPLRNRMMLVKSLVEPAKGSPGYTEVMKMGTRLYLNLQREMQRLHYQPEVDSFRSNGAKPPAPPEDEEKGNA